MPSILEVNQLVKKYGDFTAVNGVTFDIKEGEVFSLLGPNGAGKTTTISMLSTLYSPTSGDATIGGHSITKAPLAVKQVIGVVPDVADLRRHSVRELALHEHVPLLGELRPEVLREHAVQRVRTALGGDDVGEPQQRTGMHGAERVQHAVGDRHAAARELGRALLDREAEAVRVLARLELLSDIGHARPQAGTGTACNGRSRIGRWMSAAASASAISAYHIQS